MRLGPTTFLIGLALTTTACDTELQLLTRHSREPAGEHCPSGGARIEAGLDNDGDGTLADHEVDTVEYECGATVLVRQDVEPPGAACPAGGTAVRVGHDANRNGLLEDTEIEATTYACAVDTIWEGDLTITAGGDGDDQADYRDVRVVTGTLTLAGTGAVHLPALEIVQGDVQPGAQAALDLPKLHTIGGDFDLASVIECAVPTLARVGGSLHLGIGLRLAVFEAPALAQVDGDVQVIGTSAVTTVRLPALQRIGGRLELFSAAALRTVALDQLSAVGGAVTIKSADALTALDGLDALAAVGGKVEISSNDALRTVALPALETVGAEVSISFNDVLTAVDLRHLTEVPGQVYISGERLAQVDLRALGQAELVAVIGHVGAFGVAAPGTLTAVDLAALHDVGDLMLRGFATQTELALPQLARVDGQIWVDGLGALEAIRLPALTRATMLRVSQGGHLRALVLGNGSVAGVDMLSLTDLDLHLATEVVVPSAVRGNTWVMGNTLPDLRVLGGLVRTGGLYVRDNVGLTSLSGLHSGLELAALDIQGNDQLTSLAGLTMVDHLTGGLEVWGNPVLVDVSGLGNLTVIGGKLRLTNNVTLPDLHGLNLRAVGGDFEIAANDRLSTLAGLAALTHVGGALALSGGTVPASEIAALRARLNRP